MLSVEYVRLILENNETFCASLLMAPMDTTQSAVLLGISLAFTRTLPAYPRWTRMDMHTNRTEL